jgi:hypothetical protein
VHQKLKDCDIMAYKYTKEYLEPLVAQSYSIADVLRRVGVKANSGGSNSHIKSMITKHGLSMEHFTGQAHNKGKVATNKKTPEEYLIKNSSTSAHKLKLRLIRDSIKQHKCEGCNNTEWLGKPIPIELHHIDGDNTNNVLENLQILCPNCHALTDNYAGKCNKVG